MMNLDRFPRVSLAHGPTPLELMPRLTEQLGGPNLWIKRDDCTGLATGGNKTRKLEFLIGEALAQGADMVVTQGAVQSNHVRQTAAAACKVGLDCHALLERRVADTGVTYEATGNVLLDRLFGTTLEFRPAGLDMNAEALAATERLRGTGRRPYFIPGGGSNVTGALGYAVCAAELAATRAEPARIDWIVMATGSTGTQAGLVAGLHALGADVPVIGVSVRQPREIQIKAVHRLAKEVTEHLDAEPLPVGKVIVNDEYVGAGYGIPAESTVEAIMLASRLEGILLDPVYSGKGLAGLVGLVRQGFFNNNDNVVFLHTGGSAALFAYPEVLADRATTAHAAPSVHGIPEEHKTRSKS